MNQKSPYGELNDKDFKDLSEYVYDNYGINLYPNKKILVKSRLTKRLNALGMKSYREYCDFVLNKDPERKEMVEMINRISTNKTEFFRESGHFDYLTARIMPAIVAEEKNLTFWSAGCSSGEEVYTLAMVLEFYKAANTKFNYKIFGSDISTQVLKKASTAVYSNTLLPPIPEVFRKRYLLKSKDPENEVFRISPGIRRNVSFFRYNLLSSTLPFEKSINVLFCRNTLIYFDRQTQYKVVESLLRTIKTGGYLILGHSESLINMDFKLEQVSTSIYRKI